MKIYIGGDHGGFELKGKLIPFLRELGYEVEDKGPFVFDAQDDYPDFVQSVAEAVSKDPMSRGVVLGGSGQGEMICANRYKGVRGALWYGGSLDLIKLSRDHNDSNILSLGARFVSENEAREAIKLWLETPFSNDERHIRRLKKID